MSHFYGIETFDRATTAAKKAEDKSELDTTDLDQSLQTHKKRQKVKPKKHADYVLESTGSFFTTSGAKASNCESVPAGELSSSDTDLDIPSFDLPASDLQVEGK